MANCWTGLFDKETWEHVCKKLEEKRIAKCRDKTNISVTRFVLGKIYGYESEETHTIKLFQVVKRDEYFIYFLPLQDSGKPFKRKIYFWQAPDREVINLGKHGDTGYKILTAFQKEEKEQGN